MIYEQWFRWRGPPCRHSSFCRPRAPGLRPTLTETTPAIPAGGKQILCCVSASLHGPEHSSSTHANTEPLISHPPNAISMKRFPNALGISGCAWVLKEFIYRSVWCSREPKRHCAGGRRMFLASAVNLHDDLGYGSWPFAPRHLGSSEHMQPCLFMFL